jgi:hypothetical protein
MAVKTPIPEKKEIDALAALYLEAKANVDKAAEGVAVLRDQLTDMVAEHGYLPPRATKSKRLLGEKYEITLSRSQSVEVDGTAAMRFRDALKDQDLLRLFRRLFRRETVYVSAEGARETFAAQSPNLGDSFPRLEALFRDALIISGSSASLKVEPVKVKTAAARSSRDAKAKTAVDKAKKGKAA